MSSTPTPTSTLLAKAPAAASILQEDYDEFDTEAQAEIKKMIKELTKGAAWVAQEAKVVTEDLTEIAKDSSTVATAVGGIAADVAIGVAESKAV
jgi:cell division septum initiation protein DivIVA